jgi:hypothetical protein
MNRTQTINFAIKQFSYTSYLELGCWKNSNFNAIDCPHKVGVDSVEGGTLRMTTDEFFAQNKETFDIIFIDAYHHHTQVMSDVRNSLKILNKDGLIMMHDCNPHNERYELQDACGTAWRAMAHLRTDPGLNCIVGNYDYGVGIVRVAYNMNPAIVEKSMDDLTYKDLEANREEWLRLRTWEEVKAWL